MFILSLWLTQDLLRYKTQVVTTLFPGRASHRNAVSRLVDSDAAMRAIWEDISNRERQRQVKQEKVTWEGHVRWRRCKCEIQQARVSGGDGGDGWEVGEFYECWHAVCREETCTDSPVSVQLHQETPGNPAEHVNATLQHTHAPKHTNSRLYLTPGRLTHTETWKTQTHITFQSTTKAQNSKQWHTHAHTVQWVRIDLFN